MACALRISPCAVGDQRPSSSVTTEPATRPPTGSTLDRPPGTEKNLPATGDLSPSRISGYTHYARTSPACCARSRLRVHRMFTNSAAKICFDLISPTTASSVISQSRRPCDLNILSSIWYKSSAIRPMGESKPIVIVPIVWSLDDATSVIRLG